MAKPRSSSLPSHSAPTAHSSAPSPPPSATQMSLQLKQDLSMLAHSDPDTRRSSMEALKKFIEGDLDPRSMPGFLEQVSGETGKSSGSYAISLFAEVARVHREATVPFIPRIMAAVLRTLASSSGWASHANNLHQACAKVVASVARYVIEPASSLNRSLMATDVLDSLCQPLLGLLSSNVEPVAVGSATCLEAVVEAENWKLAAPELVDDVCARSSASVVEKGKHSVAHLHLMRSLATSNAGALQEHASSLLKVGIHVLVSSGGSASGCSSWQQRAEAAQLLGAIIGRCDHRLIASELIKAMKALEKCRLDKVATVRQAVGEALTVARNLIPAVDLHVPLDDRLPTALSNSSPLKSRLPEPRKGAAWKKKLSRGESCGSSITANDFASTSQESPITRYASSPTSSITSSSSSALGHPSPLSSENSTARMRRSPLFPVKQSPACEPSLIDKYMAETGVPNVLSHARSSDLKENTPLVARADDRTSLSKSDDVSHLLHSKANKVSKEDYVVDESVKGTTDGHKCVPDFQCDPLMTEGCVDLDTPSADSCRRKKPGVNELVTFHEVSEKDSVSELDDHREDGLLYEAENGKNVPEHVKMVVENHGSFHGNKQKKITCHEMTNKGFISEDFLIFSTPRRLVRSLELVSSTSETKHRPERDQVLDLDSETLSESGWSVRDNPIAGDNEDDSLSHSFVNSDVLTWSMEGPPLKGLFCESHLLDESSARCSESSNTANFLPEESTNESVHEASSGKCKSFNGCADRVPNWAPSNCHKHLNRSEEGWLSGLAKSRDHLAFLRKVHFYVESFLLFTLLLVLGLAVFITILNCQGQHDMHGLVPT